MATAKGLKIIKQAKLDYEKAKKNGDADGMAKAHRTADLARGFTTTTGVNNGEYIQKVENATTLPKALPKAIKAVAPWTSAQGTYNNSVKPIPRPIPRANTNILADAFDTKENYIDKFKQGNIAGGVANFAGGMLTGAQSVSLNALNAVDSVASGKGLPKFQYNMSKDMYNRAIVGRDGETETIKDKISNQNKVLGGIYGVADEILSDPLELTPMGYLNDIKLVKGGNQTTQAYAQSLKNGKMVGEIPPITLKSGKTVTSNSEFEKLPEIEKAEVIEAVEKEMKSAEAKKPIDGSLKKAREIAYPKVKAKLDELGIPLNSDGSVTLYHGTSIENSKSIDENGFNGMTWFSTNKDMPEQYGTFRDNGGGKVYEVKVNPSDLRLAGGDAYNHSFFASLDKLKPNSNGIYSATGEDLRLTHKKYFETVPQKQPLPRATQTIPQAPKLTVEPIKLELGTKLPQEQVFSQKAGIPKFKDLGADVNNNLPVSNISKVRSNTIENSPLFEKAKLQMEESDYAYDVIPEKQSLAEAKQRLEADFDGEVADLPGKGYFDGVDMDTSMGVMESYIVEAERTGNWAKVKEWSKVIREKGTQGGQLIQAFAKYTRTPEGVVIKGQQEVAKVERAIKEKNPTLIGKVETETKQLKKSLEKAEGESSEEVGKTLKDYAESLASKVGGTTKIQSTTKNNALNDMVDELFRVAKESPLPKKLTTQRNPIQILANAVQNKVEFADVWNRAKLIVSDKYKNNPEIMNILDDYFDKGIVPTYSQATLGKSVVKSAKELGIDFSKIIKQSSGDKEKAFNDISEYLIKEVNASESDVASLTNDILAKYNEILKAKTESTLKMMFREKTPKGKKSTYEKVMELINMGAYEDEALKDIMRARNNIPVLEDADIKGILDNMRLSDNATDPYMKKMYAARAEQIISDKIPATFMEKFAGLQRQSMLINPKTLLTRNPLGNVVLGTTENIKDIPGSAIDKLISLKTGQRTTTLNPNLGAQANGAAKGLGDWAKDIKYGVDTSPTRAQFELPNHRIYNNKLLNAADKFLSRALQLGDRPFYQAAYDGRMAELKQLGKVGEEAEENARLFALDRVFQNDSVLSKNALAIRDKLGLPGRLIMPFAQTPANIMDKLLDYSPLGMAKAISQMGTVGKGTFNQKLFVDRLGRTFTGTGIAMLGYAMAQKGILTGNTYDPTNKDKNAANTLAGVQSYAIRIGDTWQSYDFAQPIGGLLAAAADVYNSGEDGKDFMSSLGIGTVAAVNTVFNQSFMSGLLDAFSGYSPAEGIGGALLSSTTQVTPTILNNVAKTIDPQSRETYDPNTLKQQANKLIARIPFASRTLPGKLDVTGKPIVLNQGRGLGSRLAENFIAPQKVTQVVNDPVNDEVLRLNGITGDNGVFLNTAAKTISKGNETYTLTAEEFSQYQKEMGQMAYGEIAKLQKTDWYKGMTDTQKADMIVKINTQSKKIAQNSILSNRGIIVEPVSKKDYTNKANYEFAQLSKEKQEKAKPVLVSGVSKEQYTAISNKLDLNDNGAVSQDEAKQILNSSDLTQKQKAQMWQAINKSWKHNPYA